MTTDSTTSSSRHWLDRLRERFRRRSTPDAAEEFSDLLENREESNIPLTDVERRLIGAALTLSQIEADDLSIPRSDMVTVRTGTPFNDVLDVIRSSGHSRLPVIRRDTDDIAGYITLKDLLPFIGREADFDLMGIVRPCLFVPDTLPIPKVLHDMRKTKAQLGIVVDEYGGTAGLITLRDILEKIVGTIEDENEQAAPLMIIPLPGGRYQIDPRMPIEELEERLGVSFLSDDEEDEREFDTVGGLMLHMARRVPKKGEKFTTPNGCQFTVVDADARRILKLELQPSARRRAAVPQGA